MNNNTPTIFNYGMAAVRTVEQEGQVWFVAADIADILGYSRANDMIRTLEDDELRLVRSVNSIGKQADTYSVNESGLYSLIMRSNKAEAKPFRKWVTSVVLPTIRKTGGYVTQDTL
jgi:prophage antirepressor-like protein